MANKNSTFIYFLAIILVCGGLLLICSLSLAILGIYNLFSIKGLETFSKVGSFLFSTFLWAAYFIPLYLFLNAFFLIRGNTRSIITLILFLIPFITISLFLKVIVGDGWPDAQIAAQIRNLAGRLGGGLILGVCTLMQFIIIMLLSPYLNNKNSSNSEDSNMKQEINYSQDFNEFSADKQAPKQKPAFPLLLPDNNERIEELEVMEENNLLSDKEEVNESIVQNENEEEAEFYLDPNQLEIQDQEDFLPDFDNLEQEVALELQKFNNEESSYLAKRVNHNKKKKLNNNVEILKNSPYFIPLKKIFNEYDINEYWKIDHNTRKMADILKHTLKEFKITAEVTGIKKGPVITMFEILPAPGVKLSKIVNLSDNIALRLAASRVRIVAPIPGKQAVGIEIPNKKRSIVFINELLMSKQFNESKYEIPIALGKDITGDIQIVDLISMPHLLIAGATGSGKSVCVNSIICSVLSKKSPQEARLLLIDPKIVELKYFNDIPHLLTPVITNAKRAYQALQYCIYEMERRYSLLDSLCVRDIRSYNRKIEKKKLAMETMPYIIIIIDEFADLMATTGKEMESTLARLAAMSRAVGLHLVLATQRPSIDVITGLIKANIPSRIAFMVASKFDSRIIIDTVGAEKLLGQGDMLLVSSWNPFPHRMQGAYVSEEEVEELVSYLKRYGKPNYLDDEIFIDDEADDNFFEGESDPLYNKALDIILAAGRASTSYLQRKLKIGYNRAARLIEEMEMRGIVGPANGSKPREILHVPDLSQRK